jgi:2-phosphoglycerate kinase
MLYLIGGAARTGKTIIAERLLKDRNIPFFSLDYLVSALDRNLHNIPSRQAAHKIMSNLESMLRNIAEVKSDYIIEGDKLLPGLVSKLIGEYPNQIISCFLGYPNIDPEKKVKEIKQYPGRINDWTRDLSETELRDLITEMLDYSRYLETECHKYNLIYFDTSEDFSNTVEKAYIYLLKFPQSHAQS